MALITFEGIDGAGKSTAIQAAATALEGAGHTVWATREETPRFGDAIRRSIKERMDPLVTTYLFVADRGVHGKQIRQHLDSGEMVLCDRYAHSTLAYQAVTLGSDADAFLRSLHVDMPWPDHVVLLDLPADVAVGRAEARGETAPYEKVEFLEKVRQQYLRLAEAEPNLFTIVDASQDADSVAAAASDAALRVVGER